MSYLNLPKLFSDFKLKLGSLLFHLKAVGSGQDLRRKVLRWSIMHGESTETRRQYLEQTERLTFIISIHWSWRLTPHFSHANTSHLLPAPEKQKLNILLLSILHKVRLFNIRIIECNISTFLSREIVILGSGKCSQPADWSKLSD